MGSRTQEVGQAGSLSLKNYGEIFGLHGLGTPAKIIRLYQSSIDHIDSCRQAGKGSHFETRCVARDVVSYAK